VFFRNVLGRLGQNYVFGDGALWSDNADKILPVEVSQITVKGFLVSSIDMLEQVAFFDGAEFSDIGQHPGLKRI
jgi:hypothetical protein